MRARAQTRINGRRRTEHRQARFDAYLRILHHLTMALPYMCFRAHFIGSHGYRSYELVGRTENFGRQPVNRVMLRGFMQVAEQSVLKLTHWSATNTAARRKRHASLTKEDSPETYVLSWLS